MTATRPTQDHAPRQAWLRAFLVALGALLVLRALLLWQSHLVGLTPWLIPGEILAAVVLTLGRAWLRGWLIIAAAGSLAGLCYYAAGEHLHTHASLFRLAHTWQAADTNFLSATLATPAILFLPVYAAVAFTALWQLRRWQPAARPGRRLLMMLALLAACAVTVHSPTHPGNNPLVASLIQLPGAVWRSLPREVEPDLAAGMGESDLRFFVREDRNTQSGERSNILMIMIEGMSAAYLPSVADHHGLAPEIRLPRLDRYLQDSGYRIYRNFLSLQRQTHRGTYPLLCGDYPRIITAVPKMIVAKDKKMNLSCLPAILADHGYRTSYLQAAPLEFMSKNRFMPLAGFQHLRGRNAFEEQGIPVTGWGPSDADFLAASKAYLVEQAHGENPWFVTLLNVGTHHPFRAEPEGNEQARRQQAFRDMSKAVQDFLAGLDEDGLLDDTWVILTTDEAGGFRRQGERELVLDHNFGMLAVRPPHPDWLASMAGPDAITAQIDIPVTLVDLLDTEGGGNMIGRSLLVAPQRPRGLLFGDTYRARSYFLLEDGRLLDCDETLMRCSQWRFEPDRLFGTLQADTEAEVLMMDIEDRMAVAADASIIRGLGMRDADRYRTAPMEISADHPYRGGQPLSLAAGDRIRLSMSGGSQRHDGGPGAGQLQIEFTDAGSGRTLATRRLDIEGSLSSNASLLLEVNHTPASAAMTLHWRPKRPGNTLWLSRLEVTVEQTETE
ncbi:LTA synthase family protein [Spectribacter hydrogenoxidans]|uniref:LTA synthase family protein n=1 Tax=Spectribacter hydrogenoxidans TaxID=3075608 RepID=A0ABU3C3E7_9GAMM|nr:LTA synthase family protein [Salinisphaera sp. W335]MDT0636075.1 LTA synthase family protein [Salinisphaera sp. W335]